MTLSGHPPLLLVGQGEGTRATVVAQTSASLTQIHQLSTLLRVVSAVDAGTHKPPAGFPIPYPFFGGIHTFLLTPSQVYGSATVSVTLDSLLRPSVTIDGDSTVSGTLILSGADTLAVTITGTSLVQGELFVNNTVELATTIQGTSFVTTRWFQTGLNDDPREFSRFLYMYKNVGTGFDPTDTYDPVGVTVNQTFPDGNTVEDFSRWLYLYKNIGVGFNDTDDVSDRDGFVDQTFPDGNIRDFNRWLYQYLLVVEELRPPMWVTIGPTPEVIPPNLKANPPKWKD